jgi:Fe-S-cluster containining protein
MNQEAAPPWTDCQRCGACCYAKEGTILVVSEDVAHWFALGRQDIVEELTSGHFGCQAFAMNEQGACVHLGLPGAPNDCSIHDIRALVCREFQPGSWQCLEFRRDRGIDPPTRPGR